MADLLHGILPRSALARFIIAWSLFVFGAGMTIAALIFLLPFPARLPGYLGWLPYAVTLGMGLPGIVVGLWVSLRLLDHLDPLSAPSDAASEGQSSPVDECSHEHVDDSP